MHDLTGQRFGKLTAINIDSKDKFKHLRWLCKCDCGNETVVLSDNLLRNHTTSCGCEKWKINSKVHKTHGKSRSREYVAWLNMIRRCENRDNKSYADYGGRGIKVCDEWRTFEGFWCDMGTTYKNNLTLDRIDVNGDYRKENCRWITISEQQSNKRNNHVVVYNGKSMTLSKACTLRGIDIRTVFSRLKLGWSFEKAINTPLRQHNWRNKKST